MLNAIHRSMKMTDWNKLSKHLKARSKEICRDNDCDIEDDEHNCESYAYIREDGALLDICCSDYFQGCSKPYAAIPLPWTGTGTDLAKAVEDDLPWD